MIRTEMTYVVLGILSFVITYASSYYIEGDWSIDTSLSGRYTAADQLFKTHANTVLQCAALCQVHAQCFSFFLNPTKSECFGNKNPFIDHAMTSAAIGYMHYKKDFCPKTPPAIQFSVAAVDLTGQEPKFKYTCVTNSVFISGITTATCQPDTYTWSSPTIKCKDLTRCVQNGYTYNVLTETCFKYVGNKVSFDQARQTCANFAGQSNRPSNSLRQNAVASFLRTKSPNYCVWTDGNDRNIEGRYVWGNSIAITESNWNPGEPLPSSTGPNDCISMWPSVDYKWDDINCSHGCYVLCELVP